MDNMDVVVLCGGRGERLRGIVADKPKPMADINGRPFLDILLNYLAGFGFNRFILCACYMADHIRGYYAGGRKYQIVISCESSPLGTGGAVKNAEKEIASSPFLVLNGDSFCRLHVSSFLRFHKKKKGLASMVIADSEDSGDVGSCMIDDSQRIVRFEEKGEARRQSKAYVNAGIYLFEREILSMIPMNTNYSLEYDLFPQLVGGDFFGFVTRAKLIDIGTPARYEEAKRQLGMGCGD